MSALLTPTDPWGSAIAQGDLAAIMPFRTSPIPVMTNPTTTNPFPCGGPCRVMWAGVRVAYWPTKGSNRDCLSHIVDNTTALLEDVITQMVYNEFEDGPYTPIAPPYADGMGAAVSAASVAAEASTTAGPQKRALYAPSNASGTLVENGLTYVSPSVYFEIPTVLAMDDYGAIGSQYTGLRYSFPPEQISSLEANEVGCWGLYFARAVGQRTPVPSACTFSTKQFDIADIPCPPESLRSANDYSFIYNMSLSYAPILAPLTELSLLDPAWASCSVLGGWDPYTALTPATNLVAPTTPGDPTQTADPGASIKKATATTTSSSMWRPEKESQMPTGGQDPSATASRATSKSDSRPSMTKSQDEHHDSQMNDPPSTPTRGDPSKPVSSSKLTGGQKPGPNGPDPAQTGASSDAVQTEVISNPAQGTPNLKLHASASTQKAEHPSQAAQPEGPVKATGNPESSSSDSNDDIGVHTLSPEHSSGSKTRADGSSKPEKVLPADRSSKSDHVPPTDEYISATINGKASPTPSTSIHSSENVGRIIINALGGTASRAVASSTADGGKAVTGSHGYSDPPLSASWTSASGSSSESGSSPASGSSTNSPVSQLVSTPPAHRSGGGGTNASSTETQVAIGAAAQVRRHIFRRTIMAGSLCIFTAVLL